MSSAAVSQVGDWLYNVALSVYVYDRTHSSAWIGVITLMRLVPYVVLAPVGGVIADRYERRKVLLVSDLVRASVMTVLALAVAGNSPVAVVGLLAMATTAAGTAYLPSVVALIPEMLDEDDLGAGNSLTSLVQSIAVVSGPVLGAVMLALAQPVWSFVVNAGSFALGALLTSRITTRSTPARDAEHEHAQPMKQFAKELSDGARTLVEQPVVRVLTSLASGAAFVYGTQTVVLVLVATRVASSSSAVGVLYAALGAGGIVGAPIAARLSRERRLGGLALGALLVTALPMVALGHVSNTAVAFVAVMLSGMGNVTVDVLALTLLQRSVDNNVLGRVAGVYDATTVGAMIVGSLLVAPVVSALGYTSMLIAVAITAPLLVLLQLRSLVHADRDAALTWSQLQYAVDDLRRVSLFASLRPGALERLARGLQKQRFARGETIIREGEPGSTCYTVLHGKVEVEHAGAVVATLGEDEHFGEIGLLHDVPRTATVTAATDCVLYAIDAETFKAAIDADAMVASCAVESAASRLAALQA